MKKIILWDAPLRLFHWTLLFAVTGSVVTGLIGGGLMDWHGRLGMLVAGLLGFRLAWGIVGSTHARFLSFLPGPTAVIDYLKGRWTGIGHNPIGALSVFGMLGALLLQVSTGLFANDDIAFAGPYNITVSKEIELLSVWIHKQNFWLIAFLVTTHLAAISFYRLVKKDDLITPMITGRKDVAHSEPDPRPARPLALVVALAFALTTAWLANGGIAPYFAPPPPPPAETPNW